MIKCTYKYNGGEILDSEKNVKVSVIMPIYNAADYLRPAMDSVLWQTLEEIEIICIDDGSTDSSFDIVKEYQRGDSRIRIITEPNAGPALARNNGMRCARGEYLAFLDADDFYEPTFLEALYKRAKSENLDIAISSFDIYNSRTAKFEEPIHPDHMEIYFGGKVTSKNENPDYILSSTIGSAWNKVFKRSFVEAKGLAFLADVKMYEDIYFTVTALSFAERVGMTSGILMHHRVHDEQARAKAFSKHYAQVPVVYLKIKEFLTRKGMYSPLLSSYLNLSASRCSKIYRLLSHDAKEKFWNLLHNEYYEQLGWANRTAEEFERTELFDFVANVQLYTHDQYKKRCEKGLIINEFNIARTYRDADGRKKLSRFFSRLFGRK